ncbi:Spo22p RNJ42_00642 [Nakaseomyces bracarensis]|uniref:Spo22p n=1 Tax=Nakaseomyces bracarensis TaxID=273131 RepID=UPI0038725012
MNSITSTFETNLQEFATVAHNISTQILSLSNIERDDLLNIEKKIDFLTPICEKYQVSFRSGDFTIADDTILKLENAGTSLWNTLSISLKTAEDVKPKDTTSENVEISSLKYNVVIKCKYFVCLILELYHAITKITENAIRNLKCSITTLKYCTEYGELVSQRDLNLRIQNLTQTQLERLTNTSENGDQINKEDLLSIKHLKFDFYLCCFQIAIKEKDFANASIYESNFSNEEQISAMNASSIIELCRVIYNSIVEVDKSNDKTVSYSSLVELLERNLSYLELPNKNLKAHLDYDNVRFSNLVLLIHIILKDGKEDEFSHSKLLGKLLKEYPTRCDTYTFAIKCFKELQNENMVDEIENTIMSMIVSVDVPGNVDIFISTLTELSKLNIMVGLKCLDYLIENKVDSGKDQACFEELLCIRFYLTTQSEQLNALEKIKSLTAFTAQIEHVLAKELSKKTIATVITLLWNEGKKAEKREQFEEAIPYYQLACADIFGRGYIDIAKIQRTLANIYIQMGNINNALHWYHKLSTEDRKEPLSQLINFKIKMREMCYKDAELIIDEIVHSKQRNTLDVLILIIIESKSVPSITLKAVILLYEIIGHEDTTLDLKTGESMNILTLTRYTIQMLIKVNEEDFSEQTKPHLDLILKMLNQVVQFLKQKKLMTRSSTEELNSVDNNSEGVIITEIEWFAAVCYNISLKFYEVEFNLDKMSMIIDYGIQFFQFLPLNDLTFPKRSYYFIWQARCNILQYLILKKVAFKNGSNITFLLEKAKAAFNDTLQFIDTEDYKDGKTEPLEIETQEVLLTTAQNYLEILANQKKYQDLFKLVDIIAKYRNPDLDEVLMEIFLAQDSIPYTQLLDMLIRIVQRNFRDVKIRAVKLFYWIRRCMEISVNYGLGVSPAFLESAYKLLETRYRADIVSSEILKQEVELTAICCWNKGVNYLVQAQRKDGELWCGLSIRMADYIDISFKKKLVELWSSLNKLADTQINKNR